MKKGLIFGLEQLDHQGFVLTQGTFDGVHHGHQHILKQVVNQANAMGLPSMLLTFHPHPRTIVQPGEWKPRILNSIYEKSERVLDMGIDVILVLPFTETISQLTPQSFVEEILCSKIGAKKIIVGYDHHFGKNRSGDFNTLKSLSENYDFVVEEIAAKEIDDVAISSTRIRKAIESGLINEANELLGYAYPISGIVVKGEQRGRTIGFPTANIQIEEELKLLPPIGVYSGETFIDETKYNFVMNIGTRPTVDGLGVRAEAHIIGLNSDLYGRRLSLHITHFIRKEIKFDSLDALKHQIQQDITHAAKLNL